MKKLALVALLGLSSAAIAAPVGETFTGWGVGADLTSTKYQGTKRITGFGIGVDYGFDYGNNLVGLVEGKLKLNNSTLADSKSATHSFLLKEQFRLNVSYLQGYRVLPNLLPYIKVGYAVAKYKEENHIYTLNGSYATSTSGTASGFNLGIGAKYAVSSNFEIGAEYVQGNMKFGSSREVHSLGANATYRF